METSREDVGIAIRSAFLAKGTKQRFSLFALIVVSILFIFLDSIEAKPLKYFRSFVKDTIYRGALIISAPFVEIGVWYKFVRSLLILERISNITRHTCSVISALQYHKSDSRYK